MSPDQTRKTFVAKCIGLVASIGLFSKLGARGQSETAVAKTFQVRPETRAVARRDGNLH